MATARNWIWMLAFSLVFGGLGIADLVEGETLTGLGLLICGAGSGLFAAGDRRREGGRARPWRILGAVVSLVGIGLLSLAVFGGF